MKRTFILMRVYDDNFPLSNPDRPRGKKIYVTGVCLCFVMDKMPRELLTVFCCDIVLISHVWTDRKTGN
jgi:hypothetical protein